MTPAPTTTMRAGTCASASAPVEETTRFSSISTPGSGLDSEPVAITIAFASSVSTAPLSGVTVTLPGAAMAPVPWKAVILFFLKR